MVFGVVRVRRPAHAGTFYPGSRGLLVKSIEDSFMHPLGPGRLPHGGGEGRVSVGYIVPHAGYMYSGPVAAHSYYQLSMEGRPDVVVVAGPNHTGLGMLASVYREGVPTRLQCRTPLPLLVGLAM